MSEREPLRVQSLAQVYDHLRRGHWVAVVAPRFSGKSDFARDLKDYTARAHPRWKVVLVEFADVATLEGAWEQVAGKATSRKTRAPVSSAPFDLVARLRDVLQAGGRGSLCLLMNGLDSLPCEVLSLLASELRRFHGDQENKKLRERLRLAVFGASQVDLLTRQPFSPLADVLERIELPDFTKDKTGVLFSRSLRRESVSPDVLDAVFAQTAGHSHLVLELARIVKRKTRKEQHLTNATVTERGQQWAAEACQRTRRDKCFAEVIRALDSDAQVFHLVRQLMHSEDGRLPVAFMGATSAVLCGVVCRREGTLCFRGKMIERAVRFYLDDIRLGDFCCLHGDIDNGLEHYRAAGTQAVVERRRQQSTADIAPLRLFLGVNQFLFHHPRPEGLHDNLTRVACAILGADRAFLWQLDPHEREQPGLVTTTDAGTASDSSETHRRVVSGAIRNHTTAILPGNRGVILGVGGDPNQTGWGLELHYDQGIQGDWLPKTLHQVASACYAVLDQAYHLNALKQQRIFIHEIALGLQAATRLDEVFKRIVDGARDELGYECAQLALVFPEEGMIRGVRANGAFDPIREKTIREIDGLDVLAQVLRDRQPRVILDCSDPSSGCARPEMEVSGIKSQVIVPLLRGGTAIGTLQVGDTRMKQAFHPGDAQVLQLLADQAAIAIDIAREREAMETTLQAAQDAVVWVDAADRVVSCNEAYRRLFSPSIGEKAPLSAAADERGMPLLRRAFRLGRPQQAVRSVAGDSSGVARIVTAAATVDAFGRYGGGIEIVSCNLMHGLATALNRLVAFEDADKLGQAVVDLLCQYLGYARARFYWKNANGTALVSHWSHGMSGEIAAKFRAGFYELPAPPRGLSARDFECFTEDRPLVVVPVEILNEPVETDKVMTDKELRRVVVHRWEDVRHRKDHFDDLMRERIDVPVGTLSEPLGIISIDYGDDTTRRFRLEDQERLALVSDWLRHVMKRVVDLRVARAEADDARRVRLARERTGLELVGWTFALYQTSHGPCFNRIAIFMLLPHSGDLYGFVCHGAATGQEWRKATAETRSALRATDFVQREAQRLAEGTMAEAERQRVARFREMMILPGLERGLLAEVTHAKEPRGVSNAREELADLYRRLDWEPVPTAYLCPMVFEGECEGLIYVDKCFGKDTLTEWDKQVLQTAAVSLAGTAREHRLGQQLRDQILSLSHSAITPYATISGCAHELAETVTSETSRQLLTLIQSEARRGEDSIRRLLRYQQATRTGITPTLSDIDICGVVNERIEPYLAILRLCGIPCDIRVPDQAVMVTADPELLGLALGELANNAYLAVQNSALPRADRFVRVHVNSDGATNRCHVEIGNCGNRIDADRVDRLFQPFVSGTGSTGLGLWVAREMARRQGGEVRCDSASETPLFVLTIPLAGTVKTEKIA